MKRALSLIRTPLFILCALAVFFLAVNSLQSGGREESKRRLEDSLRLSAAACYAAEGIYPPDLAYLEEYYGVQIDHERYAVFYDIFAENLMPDITVVELEV